jgi:hypothetical protein
MKGIRLHAELVVVVVTLAIFGQSLKELKVDRNLRVNWSGHLMKFGCVSPSPASH